MIKLTDDDFDRLVNFIKKNYGINLEKKRVLIEGRLANMIVSRGFKSFKEFIDFAFADKTGRETIQLVNKLTTNHTYFLREPEHFEYLKNVLLPYFEKSVKGNDIRIWCAASSTGQEPYTIVMTMDEYFGPRAKDWNLKILATDIDTDVLRKAKDGIYTKEMLKDVPPHWIRLYFKRIDNERYQVIDRIRNLIEFKQFNLMDRISFTRPYDLISCRNVMIYFDAPTKNALIERFYDATREGGYLYIGHAESVARTSRYTTIKPAVYRRISGKKTI